MKRLAIMLCIACCGSGAAFADNTLPASACPAPETTSAGGGVNDGINAGTVSASGPNGALAVLGPHWNRTTLRWSQIETHRGTFSWTATDTLVKSHSGTNRSLLAVLSGPTPSWESTDFSSTVVQGDWAAFVKATVERYSGTTPDPALPGTYLPRVSAFEIWNEPNATGGTFSGTLAQYHDYILKPAVDSVRSSLNASAFLVAPAIASNQYFVAGNDPASKVNIQNALNQALGTVAGGNLIQVDAVSIHAYLAPVHIMTMGAGARAWETSQSVSLPLWLSEYGKNSDQCSGTVPCDTGETAQVCHFRDYQNRNIATPTFNVSFWFNFIDQDGATLSGGMKQFGVLAVNGDCNAAPTTSNYYSKWLFGDMQRQFGITPIIAHATTFSCN